MLCTVARWEIEQLGLVFETPVVMQKRHKVAVNSVIVQPNACLQKQYAYPFLYL